MCKKEDSVRILAVSILMTLCVVCAAFGQAFPLPEKAQDCVNAVEKSLELFKTKGTDYALKAINSKFGFTKREIYVFAISMNNVVLAHPYKPDLVGKDMDAAKDANGKFFFRDFKDIAKSPGIGWVDYMWQRPGESEPRYKKSYIVRVPGKDIYVGSGYYPEIVGGAAR